MLKLKFCISIVGANGEHLTKRDNMTKKGFSLALLSLFSSIVFGGTAGEAKPTPSWSPLIGLSVGPQWTQNGRTQTLSLTPEIQKTYTVRRANHSVVEGEIFLGIQRPLFNILQAQMGIAAALVSYTRLSGVILDDANPLFSNHIYHYQLRHSQVTLKGRLLADMNLFVTPWIGGSAGVGFNNANEFSNAPLIPEALPNNNFYAYTKNAFTYNIEVGLQRQVMNNWQIGFAYQFADWGKSQLGQAVGQSVGKRGLALNHLYTNGILFNMTYIA